MEIPGGFGAATSSPLPPKILSPKSTKPAPSATTSTRAMTMMPLLLFAPPSP